jgi:hypothetical protein
MRNIALAKIAAAPGVLASALLARAEILLRKG